MRYATVRWGAAAVLGTAVALSAAACEFSVGGDADSIGKEQVADEAAKRLEQQVGQAPDDVTCPEDLPAEVGSSIRCELTAGGQTLGVTVTTTEVDGSNVKFDIQVDEQPSE